MWRPSSVRMKRYRRHGHKDMKPAKNEKIRRFSEKFQDPRQLSDQV
jgi:hypothetical protein